MTNKQIAYAFDELANLMELHEEDEFRIRSYRNAYLALRKTDTPLTEMTEPDLKAIKGVGNAIAGKILELTRDGKMQNLEKYRAQTPPGVVEMLEVNGFGPKKVRVVWKEMGIESVGELWYACNENRLIEYKGFGLKTQEELRKKLEYYLKSRNSLHLNTALDEGRRVQELIAQRLPSAKMEWTGDLRRLCPTISQLEGLIAAESPLDALFDPEILILEKQEGDRFQARFEDNIPIVLHRCTVADFGSKQFLHTGNRAFVEAFAATQSGINFKGIATEQGIFDKANLPYVAPELRDHPQALTWMQQNSVPKLIEASDIKGVLHIHTTWSDGLHTLREMCEYARQSGYAYIGITDHSQSAFYANGLKPDRVLAQMADIDALNMEMAPFRILKGIESDILNDGNLDYDEAFLEKFDFVIASVHSNLKMTIEKATARIIRAIEHPATTILGHPTGRLLLSREGYPLDWDAVLEACARHHTAIELNANPYRLDIDYTLIPKALAHGIKISINPDAHSKQGIHDIRYGVMVARKGGLTPEMHFSI